MRQSVRHQVVSGQHAYTNLRLDASILPHPEATQNFTINNISISSIVRKGTSVTFLGHKTIKRLVVAGKVDASLVNGVSTCNTDTPYLGSRGCITLDAEHLHICVL